MGGRGSSSGAGGGGLRGRGVTEVADADGSKVDLTGMPLKYGGNDKAVSGDQRTAVEAQETKRLTAKQEYAQGFDADGNAVDIEKRGGKGSVHPTYAMVNAPVMTHNHPRETGVLGGTFSQADISTWSTRSMKTLRASTKEGTYSITKGANFNAAGARQHCHSVERAASSKYRAAEAKARKDYYDKKITYDDYLKANKDAFNACLVEMHNGYAAGAKQYGYTYTLERRK